MNGNLKLIGDILVLENPLELDAGQPEATYSRRLFTVRVRADLPSILAPMFWITNAEIEGRLSTTTASEPHFLDVHTDIIIIYTVFIHKLRFRRAPRAKI